MYKHAHIYWDIYTHEYTVYTTMLCPPPLVETQSLVEIPQHHHLYWTPFKRRIGCSSLRGIWWRHLEPSQPSAPVDFSRRAGALTKWCCQNFNSVNLRPNRCPKEIQNSRRIFLWSRIHEYPGTRESERESEREREREWERERETHTHSHRVGARDECKTVNTGMDETIPTPFQRLHWKSTSYPH